MKNILRIVFLMMPPILAGVAVIVYFAINKQAPAQKPVEEQSVHVRIVEVVPTDITPTVVGYGVVRPVKTWNGISQVGGKVVYVHPDFKKGASLTAGTVVIRLSPADYNLAIAQAEANIRATKARIKEIAITEENTRQSLQIEEEALTLKQKDLERKQQLLKRGSVAQNTVDAALSSDLAQRQKVQGMKNTLALMPTQRAVLQEQIAVYQSSLETARLNLLRTNIKLPFNARVVETKTEIDQYLVAGQSIGSFDGIESAEIEAQIPIEQFGAMLNATSDNRPAENIPATALSKRLESMGLSAKVQLNLGDVPVIWKARVSRISDTIDPKTRTVGVIVTVPNAYASAVPGIRPPLAKGMFVEVFVSNKVARDAIIIPRSALQADNVYLVGKDGRLEIRPVKVSYRQGDIAVISAGLEGGEKIVVSTLNPAIPQMLLRVTYDEELAKRLYQPAAVNNDDETATGEVSK